MHDHIYLTVIATASSSADEIPQNTKDQEKNHVASQPGLVGKCQCHDNKQTLKSIHEALIVSTNQVVVPMPMPVAITFPWLLPRTPILRLWTFDQLIGPAVSRLTDGLKSIMSFVPTIRRNSTSTRRQSL